MSVHKCCIQLFIFMLCTMVSSGCYDNTNSSNANNFPSFDIQGHRGFRGLYPENTLVGFAQAQALGVQTLELDVVISADSQVVVSHEAWLNPAICLNPEGERIPHEEARNYNLYKMPYSQIARCDCGSIGNPRFPQQAKQKTFKPRLKEVIRQAESHEHNSMPTIRYNIELKCEPNGVGLYHPAYATFAHLVWQVIQEEKVASRCTIQSFDKDALIAMRALHTNMQLALLVEDTLNLNEHLHLLGFIPDIYSPDERLVNAQLVKACHQKGMRIIPWTVNDPERMQTLLTMGVNGLITDYPNLALKLQAP